MPATVTLLVDTSQSMSRRFDFVRDARRRCSRLLRPQDRMLVVPFSRTPGADDRADERSRDAHRGDRRTSSRAAARRSSTRWREASRADRARRGRHVIVLVTDGYDEHSTHAYEEALEDVTGQRVDASTRRHRRCRRHLVAGRALLKRLATETGGRASSRRARPRSRSCTSSSPPTCRSGICSPTRRPTRRVDGTWRPIALRHGRAPHRSGPSRATLRRKPPPVRPSLEFTVTSRPLLRCRSSRDDLTVVEDGVPRRSTRSRRSSPRCRS